MDITIISSVYNEKGNLIPLVEAVVDEMENYPHVSDWEYILVDDASTDGSWQLMQKLEQSHRLCAVLSACVTDAEQHGVRFLSLRLYENELAALHVAEAVGFRVIESYLTFRREVQSEIPVQDLRVRPAWSDEVEIVADLTFRCLQSYRFFVDPLIPQARARHER